MSNINQNVGGKPNRLLQEPFITLPDGTRRPESKQIVTLPDGSKQYADGSAVPFITLPDGTKQYKDDSASEQKQIITLPDGSKQYKDGSAVPFITLPDGTKQYKDEGAVPVGDVTQADGSILHADGSKTLPDGTVVPAKGRKRKGGVDPAKREAKRQARLNEAKQWLHTVVSHLEILADQ